MCVNDVLTQPLHANTSRVIPKPTQVLYVWHVGTAARYDYRSRFVAVRCLPC